MAPSPRFFCEHCGAEVPRRADRCPSCGKFFSSVRCPSCGFVGAESLFSQGCPACGYSALPRRADPERGMRPAPTGSLPLWVYFLTLGAVLLLAVAALAVL